MNTLKRLLTRRLKVSTDLVAVEKSFWVWGETDFPRVYALTPLGMINTLLKPTGRLIGITVNDDGSFGPFQVVKKP